MTVHRSTQPAIPPFDRRFFSSTDLCTAIGSGELGGKAGGLLRVQDLIATIVADPAWRTTIAIPRMIVVAGSVFEAFMEQNSLWEFALSDAPDDRIANTFQRAALPPDVTGDFRALVEEVHVPLAVRSSSRLEDALGRPLAGVYATKMIPNNQPDRDARFQRLVEAVKFVFASTFFRSAKRYVRAMEVSSRDERMAVLIQEVVGAPYGERFYPTISAVAKSYDFYPVADAPREEGVLDLALGLGKTIVDGDRCWTCSPARPAVPPPFGSAAELLQNTQVEFWAVNTGRPPAYDPIAETEYLMHVGLDAAEYDGTLRYVASTYDRGADRLRPGTGRPGPRVLDFAPILQLREVPLSDMVQVLLQRCHDAIGTAVEIEFALALDPSAEIVGRMGFLQVRPMVVPEAVVEITPAEWTDPRLLVASSRALGNGTETGITDVVYVKPEPFESRHTQAIAEDVGRINEDLAEARRPYVLIGFGRWGSRDPWLGIPVEWGDVAGARVIVEATLPRMDVEASQGTHFFHNLSSFEVAYLMVRHDDQPGIDWVWLAQQLTVSETEFVRHVRVEAPLRISVDGRAGRGGVWRTT